LAGEQSVRTVLSAPDATAEILADVHAVIARYELLVRRYPGSGYSDNALWQGGRLALDAFARFRQPADRDAGVRLLRRLAAMFPTSKLASQVPAELAALAADTPVPTATPSKPETTPAAMKDAAPTRGRLATIRDIRRTVLPDAVRVTIELDGEVPFHDERIASPARVFVDLPGTRPATTLIDQTLRFDGDEDIVRQIRVGRHPNNVTRVVLEAAGVSS